MQKKNSTKNKSDVSSQKKRIVSLNWVDAVTITTKSSSFALFPLYHCFISQSIRQYSIYIYFVSLTFSKFCNCIPLFRIFPKLVSQICLHLGFYQFLFYNLVQNIETVTHPFNLKTLKKRPQNLTGFKIPNL